MTGVVYVWGFVGVRVAKVGQTKHSAVARVGYARHWVGHYTGSSEDPVLLLEVPAEELLRAEYDWRRRLMDAGVLPLWGRRDFFRLDPVNQVLAGTPGWRGVYEWSPTVLQ